MEDFLKISREAPCKAMEYTNVKIQDTELPVFTFDAVVVGSGAAGYNCALRLREYGISSVAIVTEGIKAGTSRNTGSDKQTYYKLNLCGDYADSPHAMAEDFFAGKCVDGDHALCEAALSVPSFIHLCGLGVPFPTNRYGEYVGYKTDHDPRARATSAGPLTSKLMTECLERAVEKEKITVLDGMHAVRVLKDGEEAVGILCVDASDHFAAIRAGSVVFATGGPAGVYADTVYPMGHTGSSGVLFEAGVKGKNLTEWQFGLASTAPRWNVSGTYMQVLPRFVSVDPDGTEHEFLSEYFADTGRMLSMVFKKGYEWPFDCRKVMDGSSIIDLLVYRECKEKGRRVYLDFTKNPEGLAEVPFASLMPEAYEYLEKAEALFGTPIERLAHMNAPAIDLYRDKGVDITKEYLEIALCAQHQNGGADVDLFWQTGVRGLFVAGEAAGTHGVYRPGGSALNAGQVGSMRAAQYIAECRKDKTVDEKRFFAAVAPQVEEELAFAACMAQNPDNAADTLACLREDMSRSGGAIRRMEEIAALIPEREELYASLSRRMGSRSLLLAYVTRDTLVTQLMLLVAMKAHGEMGGGSRGSGLYTDEKGSVPLGFSSDYAFALDDGARDATVLLVDFEGGKPCTSTRSVRPLPEGAGFFENVWRTYRENKNIY